MRPRPSSARTDAQAVMQTRRERGARPTDANAMMPPTVRPSLPTSTSGPSRTQARRRRSDERAAAMRSPRTAPMAGSRHSRWRSRSARGRSSSTSFHSEVDAFRPWRPRGTRGRRRRAGSAWFDVYPNETTTFESALRWTGLSQNWNSACAECHATDLRKQYRAESQSYETTYSETGVTCEACHGPGSRHVEWATERDRAVDPTAGLAVRLGGDTLAWGFNGRPIAERLSPLRNEAQLRGLRALPCSARADLGRLSPWSA